MKKVKQRHTVFEILKGRNTKEKLMEKGIGGEGVEEDETAEERE